MRTALRQQRCKLTTTQQDIAAQALIDSVIENSAWPNAQRIALYLCADGEINAQPLANFARSLGKQLYLPMLAPASTLNFGLWLPDEDLVTNRYNIPEPPANAMLCPPAELDIIFLPLVAWDAGGGRLGMGGGYYDRTLAGVSGPLLIGLAHTCQQVEKVSREAWDISLDFVATDTKLHPCQGTA